MMHRHRGIVRVRTKKGRVVYRRKPLHNISKNELISRVADKHKDFARKDVASIIDTSNQVMVDEFKKGHKVSLKGFGVFRIVAKKARPARKGINPLTGKECTFKAKPASKVIRFRASKEVKV